MWTCLLERSFAAERNPGRVVALSTVRVVTFSTVKRSVEVRRFNIAHYRKTPFSLTMLSMACHMVLTLVIEGHDGVLRPPTSPLLFLIPTSFLLTSRRPVSCNSTVKQLYCLVQLTEFYHEERTRFSLGQALVRSTSYRTRPHLYASSVGPEGQGRPSKDQATLSGSSRRCMPSRYQVVECLPRRLERQVFLPPQHVDAVHRARFVH